ncbi:MAG: hypothetical protein JWQ38_1872 [Flavipsychrobacter sp.]|nr:hypothetical protein [Flavipsychrobacter sp.]
MAKKKPDQNNKNIPAKPATVNQPAQPKKTANTAIANDSFLQRYAQPLIVSGIALFTFLVLKTCLNNKFTNWDDIGYVTSNPLIKHNSWDAIKAIFSVDNPVMGNYHPLTILTYAIEYSYQGLEPFIYHLDSILIHILVTISVYLFIKVLTGRTVAAAIAALLFGIHPMHVESIAWAAGRKDLIYSLFYVLSCTTYIFYIRTTGSKRIMWYIAGIVLFALSLLAKSVAVTLPVALFLFDYYEQRKPQLSLLLEKIPHFALSLLFGLLSIDAQKKVGALGTLDVHFNPIERAALGCYALSNYLWKAIAPSGLSNFYPYPMKVNDALPGSYYTYLVVIIALVAAIWYFGRKNKIVVFGTVFFLINMILLLQFMPVGGAIMSDRYGYLPYMGLFLIAGWFVSNLFEGPEKKPSANIVLGGVLIYCTALGYLANERCQDWYNSVTLWQDDAEKHPESPIAYFYLGQEYFGRYESATNPADKKGKADTCLMYFNASVERKPDYINPIICIGELQRTYGQIDAAKATYYRAMKINPKNESVYLGLAIAFCIKQQFDSADYCFRTALSLNPYLPEGHSNYANFLDIVGKTDSSLKEYAVSLAQNPDVYIPYMNRARLYIRQKKFDEAIADYNMAMTKKPEDGEPYYQRSRIYSMRGNKAQARQDVEKAIALGYPGVDKAYYESLK